MTVLKTVSRRIRHTSLALVAVGLVWPGIALGDEQSVGDSTPVSLASGRSIGDVAHVQVDLEVGGELSLTGGGRLRKLPMSVVAKIGYEERLLEVQDGLRSIRHYDEAEAALKIDKGGLKPVLGNQRRRMVAEWSPLKSADGRTTMFRTTMFSVDGPLTREELELVDIVGSSLVVDLLLPADPVAVGQSWKHSDRTIAALLRLDRIAQCEVQSVLGEVTDGVAKIAMAGTVHGTADGLATEIELKGRYDFSLQHRRITRLQLAVKEKRATGRVGPGLDVVAKLKMRIEPLEAPVHLTDASLAGISTEPQPRPAALVYLGPRGNFRLTYSRRWYVTSDEPNLTVLRLVDRGKLVAQCNISELSPRSAQRHTSLSEFQHDIRFALGDRFGGFVEAEQWADPAGNRVFRAVARGEVEQLPIQWRYYLIATKSGRRLALSFTLEAPLAGRLGDADRRLVAAVQLLDKPIAENATPETASNPSPEKRKSQKR